MIKPAFRPLFVLPLALALAGCMQDSASYTFPEKDHAITLIRMQDWPWQSSLSLDVMAVRMPDCNGGLRIRDVPRKAEFVLFQAPDTYAEPIFILRVDRRNFAVSTASCRVQEFKEAPEDAGRMLGHFRERDGGFAFVPAGD
ncbi:MAG: hypothetical protein FJ209_03790 [Betaproteobacteria bacterium]|nr:hypothetical protein [Betaproteobacteria bacterium]